MGHVEWVQFARVPHVPAAGEVIHATEPFEEPAGGGAVAAVQLARLAGDAQLFTALGRDEHGRRSLARLSELGVSVHAERVPEPTRRAITLVDDGGERTITTLGPRLQPRGEARELAWTALDGADAVYFTAGDLDALRDARTAAGVLVASPRARGALGNGVPLDVLVMSGSDEVELDAAEEAAGEAEVVVRTAGAEGGTYRFASGEEGSWDAVAPPGAAVDSYGCGDAFAAGLTFALGAGYDLDGALHLAARCGAFCLSGLGPYGRLLGAQDL